MNTASTIGQPGSSSKIFIENNDADDSQEHVTFLKHLHIKPRHHHQSNMNTNSNNTLSTSNRTPLDLLEFKQQRSVVETDRRNRLITRIISIVGLLIILLCAAIVTLTLKMAPKIDELVRTKTGVQPSVHLIPRIITPSSTSTTVTSELYNITTNYSLVTRSTYRTRPRSYI